MTTNEQELKQGIPSDRLEQLLKENAELKSLLSEIKNGREFRLEMQVFDRVKERLFNLLGIFSLFVAVIAALGSFITYLGLDEFMKEHIENTVKNQVDSAVKYEAKEQVAKKITEYSLVTKSELNKAKSDSVANAIAEVELQKVEDKHSNDRPQEGWVLKSYLSPLDGSGTLYKINTYRLNFRKKPDANAEIFGRQIEGAKVKVKRASEDGRWVEVEVQDK